MVELNRESPFRQMAGVIRKDITDGRLRAGDKAPTVRELVAEYEVAYATAHRAVKLLQAEGYLVARAGRGGGSFVTSEEERSRSAAEHAEKAARTGYVYPEGQYARIIETGMVAAPDQVADALGVGRGDQVIFRKRVRYTAEDKPSSMSTSWFPGDLAEKVPELLIPERVKGGTFKRVAEALGRTVVSGDEQVWAVAAPADVADLLSVGPGTPITAGRNWFTDDRGNAVEYGESFTAGRLTARWGSAGGE